MANPTPTERLAEGAHRATELADHLPAASCLEALADLLAQAERTNEALRQVIGDPKVAPPPSPTRTALAVARLAAARTTTPHPRPSH